jgi:nitrate reductase gamma subunit
VIVMTTPTTIAMWVVFPYLCLGISTGGHIWRFRADGFRWSNRTIKADEKRSLGLGSALFHYGIIASMAGHALGLLVPASLVTAAGEDPTLYRSIAVVGGILAGSVSAVGLGILMYRRLTNKHLRKRTAGLDGLSYALLGIVIVLGLCETSLNLFGTVTDFRETVSVWFRGILTFSADPQLIAGAPLFLQAHVIAGLLLCAIWPFTRLVHTWSAPAESLWKPSVYRSRFAREHPSTSSG